MARKGIYHGVGAGPADPFVPQTYDPDSREGLKLSFAWWIIGTGRLWRNLMDERLKTSDQTQPRWRVLAWARMLPGIKQTDLADRMGIADPTLVRILDNLETQGMIERREAAGDRRVKEIRLTAKAEPMLQEIGQEVLLIRDSLLQDVSDEELRICLSVMARVRARVPELSGKSVTADLPSGAF
jgi:MarR family transcriptional regulator for hemolysin